MFGASMIRTTFSSGGDFQNVSQLNNLEQFQTVYKTQLKTARGSLSFRKLSNFFSQMLCVTGQSSNTDKIIYRCKSP